MELEHHRDLAHEFPELRHRIRELKLESAAFRQLYAEYQALDNEVYRIEQDIETPADDYAEELKRRRVRLKDRLYGMLTGRIAAIAEADEFVVRYKFRVPVDHGEVAHDWIVRGFAHDSDELVTVVEGRLEVLMRGEGWELEPGDELYVPRGVVHTVRNTHDGDTRWLYGYD